MKKKIRQLAYLLTIMAVVVMLTYSCKKEEENKTLPILTTASVSNITQSTAMCGGNVSSEGGSKITVRGVCWSMNPSPTINDNKTIDSFGVGHFLSSISGLRLNSTYYVRAYASNSSGTSYGSVEQFTTTEKLTDFDGNIYDTIIIGNQVWLKQNLNVVHYRNGDPITNLSWGSLWSTNITEAYCDYSNSIDTSKIYGRLYNWYAVNDTRKITPVGWHIATIEEWSVLINYLGGEKVAGSKIKEAGNKHWVYPNSDATNESGFTALPGGGIFSLVGHNGRWWSSSLDSISGLPRDLLTSHLYGDIHISTSSKAMGNSVRCIKDN